MGATNSAISRSFGSRMTSIASTARETPLKNEAREKFYPPSPQLKEAPNNPGKNAQPKLRVPGLLGCEECPEECEAAPLLPHTTSPTL